MEILTIFLGVIALIILAAVFFALLRLSNKLFLRRLHAMNEHQKSLEKLVGKFIDMTVENRKEIAGLKKELGKGEIAVAEPARAEIKKEESGFAEEMEKAVALEKKRHKSAD